MADENRVTWYCFLKSRTSRSIGSGGGKKSADSASAVDQGKGACGWDRSVTASSEKGAGKKRKRKGKIIIFRLEISRAISRGRGLVVSIWNKKREEYIPTRFFFYKIFSFEEERWFLLIEICFSIIYGWIVKKSLAKDEKKLYFAFTWMDY